MLIWGLGEKTRMGLLGETATLVLFADVRGGKEGSNMGSFPLEEEEGDWLKEFMVGRVKKIGSVIR